MLLLCLVLGGAANADPRIDQETRSCVTAATSTSALIACEQKAQRAWRTRLEELHRELLDKLQGSQREHFLAAHTAWGEFRSREFQAIDDSFEARGDGLAVPLAAGAKTELLRQRAEQLATHLRNLQQQPANN